MEVNLHHQQISLPLVNWFTVYSRDLPWRKEYSPYSIWISEIMLQQTQVDRVIPYYLRWMQKLPTIEVVSRVSYQELLKLWEGLGYYSRVRQIHKAAQIIQHDFAGQFPKNHTDLIQLPGIGPYTAGAIMSIAYNQNFPLVDGNVARVLTRIFNIEESIGRSKTKKYLWKKAEELIIPGCARWLNQALMELGARICTPKKPFCQSCPIITGCQCYQLGIVEQRPVIPSPPKNFPIKGAIGILIKDGLYFIQQRPSSGLMPDLWEFPGGKVEKGEKPEETLIREFYEELELQIQVGEFITVMKHGYTKFSVTLYVFYCTLVLNEQIPMLHFAVDYRWVKPEELTRYAFPAANRRLVDMLTYPI